MEPTRAERFEALFRENYPAVRAYALRGADREPAEDAVAETFLVAWRRLDLVPDDALPWLYGTARRALANQRRAAGRQAALRSRMSGAEVGSRRRDVADAVADAEIVRAALASLPDRDREALMLMAWDGLSGARAARAAGCSRGAFAVRLHRARVRLAAELNALDEAPLATAGDSVEAS